MDFQIGIYQYLVNCDPEIESESVVWSGCHIDAALASIYASTLQDFQTAAHELNSHWCAIIS